MGSASFLVLQASLRYYHFKKAEFGASSGTVFLGLERFAGHRTYLGRFLERLEIHPYKWRYKIFGTVLARPFLFVMETVTHYEKRS